MILVMGASGNIGKELVKELKARGAEFKAGYRSAEQVAEAKQNGISAVRLDYMQPDTLEAALEGIAKVFLVSPPTPHLGEGEINVIAMAQQMEVQHIVYLSVWRAEDGFIFGRPHYESEQHLRKSGLEYTFLRPNGFMQNMLGNAATMKAQGAFYMPAGEARVSEIDVRDIARVAAVTLTSEGHEKQTYALSGPEALTEAEKAQRLSEALHRPISYIPIPEEQWKAALLGAGVPEWNVDGLIDLHRFYQTGNFEEVTPWVETLTGKAPTSYRQFVQDYAGAFQ
ncbi:MAG TPA: SDR family oxidoreductase [Chthonomonadaceae bacterium]|nr:SDR family oxidoreductase [Chthonomonadaceae bacterium]